MTWREVLDAKNLALKRDEMAEICVKLGYRFFAFNGCIYFVPNAAPAMAFDTGLLVDSLKK